jgi:hypothetical protein
MGEAQFAALLRSIEVTSNDYIGQEGRLTILLHPLVDDINPEVNVTHTHA